MREFRRSTDDLRSSVESEFYRMDGPPKRPTVPEKPEGAPVPVEGPRALTEGANVAPARVEGEAATVHVPVADANANAAGHGRVASDAKPAADAPEARNGTAAPEGSRS
jgi:sec-independent protein translocase protein TatB